MCIVCACGVHESTGFGFTQNNATNDQVKAVTIEGKIKTAMDTADYNSFISLMSEEVSINLRLPETGDATMLIYSAYKDLPQFTYYLLKQNADKELVDENGLTALDVAQKTGGRLRVQTLLDPDRQKTGQIQMMDAVKKKKVKTLEDLLVAGIDPNFIDEETGETPLTRSILVKKAGNVVGMLSQWSDPGFGISKIDINFPNRENYTPLGYAILNNNEDAIRILKALNAKETL